MSNGGCDQLCIPTDTGRECSCLHGYTLNADGTSCTGVFCVYVYVCVCVCMCVYVFVCVCVCAHNGSVLADFNGVLHCRY